MSTCPCGTFDGVHNETCPDREVLCPGGCGFIALAVDLQHLQAVGERWCEDCVTAFCKHHCERCGDLLSERMRTGGREVCERCREELIHERTT